MQGKCLPLFVFSHYHFSCACALQCILRSTTEEMTESLRGVKSIGNGNT